jgi:hypothetical protein
MVYQEQVMQIVHELGGIPLRAGVHAHQGDQQEEREGHQRERPKFVEGAGKGLSKKDAEELFELILKFAGYGFNKSHSTGYAIVAYQTAYLKTYFPAQYMAAFLSFESQAQKVATGCPISTTARRPSIDPRRARRRTGIEVAPPDVNLSQADFSVVFDEGEPREPPHGHIRFGLKAIKGAGGEGDRGDHRERDGARPRRGRRQAVQVAVRLLRARPAGQREQGDDRGARQGGAFDGVHGRDARSSMVATIEQAVSAGQRSRPGQGGGQNQLFGFGGGRRRRRGGRRRGRRWCASRRGPSPRRSSRRRTRSGSTSRATRSRSGRTGRACSRPPVPARRSSSSRRTARRAAGAGPERAHDRGRKSGAARAEDGHPDARGHDGHRAEAVMFANVFGQFGPRSPRRVSRCHD